MTLVLSASEWKGNTIRSLLHLAMTLLLLACVSCTSEGDRPATSSSDAEINTTVEPVTQTLELDQSPIALPRNQEVVQKSDLVGKRFRSSSHCYLSFEDQRVRWDYSDVRESGSYTVDVSGSLTVHLGMIGDGPLVEAFSTSRPTGCFGMKCGLIPCRMTMVPNSG